MVVLKNKALLSITLAVLMGAGLLVAALLVAPVNPAGAAFPGTNGKIALSSYRDNAAAADYDIYTVTPGGGATQLTRGNTSSGTYDIDKDPNYSADGTKIAFSSNRNSPAAARTDYSIWTMNADGSDLQRRTTDPGTVDTSPAWSPNGQQIAFERGGKIYRLTLGGGVNAVTDVGTADKDPNWSPDGNQIAFERNGDIYTANANAKNDVTQRVTGGDNDTDPNWSPNGNQIVFVRGAAGAGKIYKHTLGGSTQPVVTGANDTNPAYSPDGTQIVFDRGGNIYTANANGQNADVNPLTNGGQATDPDWGVGSPQPGPTPGPTPTGCTKTGTSGPDDLVGTSGADKICGLGGDDTLRGRQGNDELIAGDGTDKAYGGRGPDNLNTQDGLGGDLANGGRGTDNCTTDAGDTRVSC
jgi:TolB protein